MENKLIFVDTWAWYAMSDRNDKDHQKANELNRKLVPEGYRYVTSNFVFSETYTLILIRSKSHRAAISFGEKLKQLTKLGAINYIRITEDLENEAWDVAKKYDDKDFSYVDCTSFAIMNEYGISRAFTDDDHFTQFGFQIAK